MFRQVALGLVIGLAARTACAAAETDNDLARRFGALESLQHIALSPDGDQVSYLTPMADKSTVLFVAKIDGSSPPKAIVRQGNKGEVLRWCRWATNERLICQISAIYDAAGQLLGFTRLITVNADGSGQKMLTQGTNSRSLGIVQSGGTVLDWDIEGQPGHVLMTRQVVPERSIGTNIGQDGEGLGVDDIDLASLSRKPVERPKRDAVEYIGDGHGQIRIMGMQAKDANGYVRPRLSYLFRRRDSRDWEKLSSIAITGSAQDSGFEPYAIDATKDLVYGFDDQNGYQALVSLSLDGLATRQVVLSRADVDVDELIRIGREGRVVGASYATERRTSEFFDPELKKLGAALQRALPGKPSITFVDASAGEGKLLLFASSDTNSGVFYLYDKATRQLSEILPLRAELGGIHLAEMKPITYPAADGTQIPGYLTLPPGSNGKGLPAIVMPHGGPGARDEWGFDWLAQFFAARGYAVLQPNFRGSAGYGSAWYQKNGFQSWRTAIGDVNDAGRWLVSQGITTADKLGILGWSYGGYAALQTSVLDPDLFKAIVAVAPVTDLEMLRSESRDFSNYPIIDKFIGNGPHVREGSPAQNVARIKAPVMLFHGDLDQNVGVNESKAMAGKLRSAGKVVDLNLFPGLDHQLADSQARMQLLAKSDAFFRKYLGITTP